MSAATPPPRFAWILAVAALVAIGGLAWIALQASGDRRHAIAQTTKPTRAADKPQPPARFVAVAGGSAPDSNPISLEQNLTLAHTVLPGPGVLLFGSGGQGATVQVLDPSLPRDPLLHALGELFSPRAGRDSRYQVSVLPAARASDASVRTELSIALSVTAAPLVLYMSGHGEQAQEPRDNIIQLWGGDGLSASDIAELHDRARGRRGLRAVITSCFSGGFAELAFKGADDTRGPSDKTRCGLFAATWDLESSGCDPNPDRAAQEGYSLHFLNALRGLDRDGVTPIDADYDDDGKVSLLEAHSRARIAGRSIDVPTSTSERWLRAQVDPPTDNEGWSSPEEDAVIAALSAQLGARDRLAAQRALERVEEQLQRADELLTDAHDQNDAAYRVLSMGLLERWPVLDDPYHPLYADTLQRDRDAILRAVTSEEDAQHFAEAQRVLEDAERALLALEEQRALHLRLTRAHENRHLAADLKRQGGKAWSHYQALLACERGLP